MSPVSRGSRRFARGTRGLADSQPHLPAIRQRNIPQGVLGPFNPVAAVAGLWNAVVAEDLQAQLAGHSRASIFCFAFPRAIEE